MNRTKHLHMILLEKGPEYRFTYADVSTLAGVSPRSVKTILHNLVSAGAVERVKIEPGTVQRERVGNGGYTGARAAYRVTGKPYEEVGRTIIHDEGLEPRVKCRPHVIRWRSIGARLMGDPPLGRSALSGFNRLSDLDKHRWSCGLG